MDDLTDLRSRLTRIAERTAPPPTAAPVVVRALAARHRQLRRQRVGVGAAVLAVAAVVAVVPATVGGGTARTAHDVGAPTANVLSGATRGSLAGDAEFVDGVRRLPWASAQTGTDQGGVPGFPGFPDPAVDTRRVVYAGEVAGTRFALVVGENDALPEAPYDTPERQTDLGALSHVAAAWFTGPAGAPAAGMTMASVPRGVDTGQPMAFADSDTGALAVVSAPGDDIELSTRPEVSADASVLRTWRPVPAQDGVAAVDLADYGATVVPAVRYRVQRAGVDVTTMSAESSGTGQTAAPTVPLTPVRPGPTPAPGDAMVGTVAEQFLTQVGLQADEVRGAVLWAGDVPGPHDQPARVTLIALTLPSGAVYLVSPWGYDQGAGGVGGSWCGTGLVPAGQPLDQRTVTLRCDVGDGSEHSGNVSSLVVVAPPAAVTARALDLDGAVLGEYPLTDGVAVVPFPERAATVETSAADGSPLATSRPITYADLGG